MGMVNVLIYIKLSAFLIRLIKILHNCLFTLNWMVFYLSTFLPFFPLVWPCGKAKNLNDILLMQIIQ